ncbi:hypothetical protein T484DRAFT_1611372, partial [Baffinella frigidus]
IRNPKPETRNPKPETQNPKPETRNPKHYTLTPEPSTQAPPVRDGAPAAVLHLHGPSIPPRRRAQVDSGRARIVRVNPTLSTGQTPWTEFEEGSECFLALSHSI